MSFETPSLAVLCENAARLAKAKELARDLDVPLFLGAPLGDFDFLLAVTAERVELRKTGDDAPGALSVDFTAGSLDYRRRQGGSQMILKAIGGSGKKVFDATAGLARDSFILAGFGCHVTAREKSMALAALVLDALERACLHEPTKFLKERLDFAHGDSQTLLAGTQETWDVIFLDPMFPKKDRKALPKKELQILQEFLGIPENEDEVRGLLALALKKAPRVVVKRHLHSPELREGVTTSFKGASTRFDLYVNH